MSKRAIVSVINDLATDQRVRKVCDSLTEMGFDILLVGRKLRNSPHMDKRPYAVKRMHLLFHRGPLFYAEYQFRLSVLLLFQWNVSLLVANDLDTLLPNYLVSKIKRCPLVYDSHEYFTGVPELQAHPGKQKIWKAIESAIFPKLKSVFTVNNSIAELYHQEYGLRPVVVRNVPPRLTVSVRKTREELGLPADKKILIMQGSGINVQRGAEEMVEAMQWVEDAILLLVGGGDVVETLKRMVDERGISHKVMFKGRMPYPELMQYTRNADLGLSLDKPLSINYQLSLPNKIFDYLNAGIPVLASPLVEVKKIIEQYQVGDFIPNHQPKMMADKINEIFLHDDWLVKWRANAKKAAEELNWENESTILKKVYQQYV